MKNKQYFGPFSANTVPFSHPFLGVWVTTSLATCPQYRMFLRYVGIRLHGATARKIRAWKISNIETSKLIIRYKYFNCLYNLLLRRFQLTFLRDAIFHEFCMWQIRWNNQQTTQDQMQSSFLPTNKIPQCVSSAWCLPLSEITSVTPNYVSKCLIPVSACTMHSQYYSIMSTTAISPFTVQTNTPFKCLITEL